MVFLPSTVLRSSTKVYRFDRIALVRLLQRGLRCTSVVGRASRGDLPAMGARPRHQWLNGSSRVVPIGVNAYSTLGGTTGYIVRRSRPPRSSWRSVPDT